MATFRPAMVLALAAAVLAAGCDGAPPEAARGRDVVRPALGFALNVPEGWTWRDLAGDVVLEIFRQAADAGADAGEAARGEKRARPVVHVVVVDREGATLDEWADQALEASKELQADLEVVGRRKALRDDGREALTLTLKSPRGLEPIVQRMLLVVTDVRACAVLATAPESDVAGAEAAFKECFDSLLVW